MSSLATDKEKNGALSVREKSVVFCIIAYFSVLKRDLHCLCRRGIGQPLFTEWARTSFPSNSTA